MSRQPPGRGPVTLIAAAGAATSAIAAQVSGAPAGSLAWALAAGIGLTLMLKGAGLRLVGALLGVLALAGAGWAGRDGQWPAVVGFVVAALGAAGMAAWGPRWRQRAEGARSRTLDPWAAMDAGHDPTDEHDLQSPHEAR